MIRETLMERQDELDQMTMEELNTKASMMLNQKVTTPFFRTPKLPVLNSEIQA